MSKPMNVYVDYEGRTYRVARIAIRPLIVIRVDWFGKDTGRALKLDGALARKIIRKASENDPHS